MGYQLIGHAMFMALLFWPIIINSQPGTTFYVFGIDWKADNLDNTMFWTGVFLAIVSVLGAGIVEKIKQDREEKIAKLKRYT